MEGIEELIESLRSQASENEGLKNKLKDNTSMIKLLGIVQETVEELLEGQEKLAAKEFFDEKLAEKIAKSIKEAIEAFTKQPTPKAPVVNNTVSVDLKPLQSIASDISQQNKTLVAALERSGNGGTDLYKLVVSMMARQNDIIDRLTAAINKPTEKVQEKPVEKERPMIKRLKIVKENYSTYLVPEYSTTK